MLSVIGTKSGHSGGVAVLNDNRLELVAEGEKGSNLRHGRLEPDKLIEIMIEHAIEPDVVALGGWGFAGPMARSAGTGYMGLDRTVEYRRLFGKEIALVRTSHERAHIACAIAMAPDAADRQWVLLWEGRFGSFYLVRSDLTVEKRVEVMTEPGARFASLWVLADTKFADDRTSGPALDLAGKLMAIAGLPARSSTETAHEAVRRLLTAHTMYPVPKSAFRDLPIYNSGIPSDELIQGARVISDTIFETFSAVADSLEPGLPLRIAGGCGLNCEWNTRWRSHPAFSSVFIPPCPDDSGAGIGAAVDGLWAVHPSLAGVPLNWSVYSGEAFRHDIQPPSPWSRQRLELHEVARWLADGEVIPWVEGRYEVGPRALGARSLLAEPFSTQTRDRLNQVKQRESFRPIAPICLMSGVAGRFAPEFADPYMLYFRSVTEPSLAGVRHADGTARVQTLDAEARPLLASLLRAFESATGHPVLANTSLNFHGTGFINSVSELVQYCDRFGLRKAVVDGELFIR